MGRVNVEARKERVGAILSFRNLVELRLQGVTAES
jgi:hypothetical protein